MANLRNIPKIPRWYNTSLVMCEVDFTTNSCGFLVEVKQESHIQSNCLTKALTPQREPKQILHQRNIQIHLKASPCALILPSNKGPPLSTPRRTLSGLAARKENALDPKLPDFHEVLQCFLLFVLSCKLLGCDENSTCCYCLSSCKQTQQF